MKNVMLAFDLDGTLTNSRKEVTPRTRSAILQAISAGATIVLASGRPTFGIRPVADCLGLEERGGYILAFNGGCITDCRSGSVVFEQHMPERCIPTIVGYAREHDFALLGYNGSNILTERPADKYVAEESRINRMGVVGVDSLPDALPAHSVKLLMTGDPSHLVQAEEELSALLDGQMDVYRSAPFFLELVARGIDKARSLTLLLEHCHIPATNLTAFGDGYNDISMLRLAGRGVAMANAAPEVRAAATEVTLSNDEDGVALVIEQMLAQCADDAR